MEKFRKLGISEPVLKSIQEQEFEEPSEIQEKSIPLILEGKDIIAGAATGSGKTLVFAAGIIKNAEKGRGIQALILTPTRELAEQVSTTIQKFAKHKHLEIMAVYGGVSISPQIYYLRNADVVVGTPGRILDHISRRTINLDNIKILVLDEADRMLDMGFKDDVEKIIEKCPTQRQTMLFSATISQEIARLARKYMHNPIEISAEAYVDPTKLKQVYYDVEDDQKFSLLVHFMKKEHPGLIMVFCNTQRNTDFISNNLMALGIDAIAIHGGYSQDKRTRTMQKFNEQRVAVLVCTDVAARGLDIKGVSHIYNYDIPKDDKEYIHRIGRTARAGKEGKVVNILARRDYENFQKVINNPELKIQKEETPEIERVYIRFKDNRTRGFGERRFGGGQGRHFGRGYSSHRHEGGYGHKERHGQSRQGYNKEDNRGENRESSYGRRGEREDGGRDGNFRRGNYGNYRRRPSRDNYRRRY
jgi:ATP-dependent RNA helicase DeaD